MFSSQVSVSFLVSFKLLAKFVQNLNETNATMVGKNQIKKFAWPIVIGFVAFTTFFGVQLADVKFDYDFEKFFPIDDPETKFFFEHRAKFESDNDFLLIAIENKKGIFDLNFLKKVDRYAKEIGKQELVTSINCITTQNQYFLLPNGLTAKKPYINFENPNLKSDSVSIYNSEELINTIVSKDGKSLCLFVKHKEYISKKKSDVLINSVYAVNNKYNFDKIFVAGRTVGQSYYIEKMNYEMLLYVGLSAILIVLFLFIAFRSIWGILIPQLILLGSLIWIVGLMGFFNQPINIILTTLPSVMFVVAMSDVIHLVSRYLDAKRVTDSTLDAIVISVKEVGLAMFLTSFTTAIGFFTLYFVNVEPIRIYGIVLGCGVLIAFALTIITLPILFYFFPGPKHIIEKKEDHFWKKRLHNWFQFIVRKRKMVLLLTIFVTAISAVGMLKIEANNYLMDDMRESEPMKQDFNYLDKHYGGIRPFELAVILKDTSKTFWDVEVLAELNKVEEYVEKKYGAEIKQSLCQTIKVINRSSHAGLPDYYEIPEKQRTINGFKRKLQFVEGGKLMSLLIDSLGTTTRISGGIGDLGNTIMTKKNVEFDKFLAKMDSKDWLEFKLTGTSHLLDKNMNYLAISLVKGLLLSVVIISIIPNIIPLIIVAGIMGYFGITLKTSTAIIFTIAFGIAVDDTIHLLGKFKHELLKGNSKMYALKRSYLTTGKAMVLTTLILCSGFLLLMLSTFLGTFYMGLLLSLTLFFALILDLTLLPVLIILFYHPKIKSKAKT